MQLRSVFINPYSGFCQVVSVIHEMESNLSLKQTSIDFTPILEVFHQKNLTTKYSKLI